MTRSKALAIALVALSLFAVGCASGGMKKPTVFIDKPNSIPADIPSQFDSRYERFISDKEMETFHKLQTDEERQAFQDKFWAERDTDPTTPDNEYKEEIDGRIDDIASELFFGTSGTVGLLFSSHGGFRGDMAQVYLLYGEPDAMDVLDGHSFVPLMLWIYGNPENSDNLYAFLFYQKGGSGTYSIFWQDSYQMDQCGAIYEVATPRTYHYIGGGMRSCPEDLYQIYEEIRSTSGKGGIIDGHIFARALFNFSNDSSLKLGEALQPPKPVSEVARQSKARVTGEAPKLIGTAGPDYIFASCESCNSMIPGELQIGKEFILVVRRGDIDWRVVGEQTEIELKVRIILENTVGRAPLIFEKKVSFQLIEGTIADGKHMIASAPKFQVFIPLLTTDEVAQIPAGTYQVSVYIKNVTPGLMTKKYNALYKELIK